MFSKKWERRINNAFYIVIGVLLLMNTIAQTVIYFKYKGEKHSEYHSMQR